MGRNYGREAMLIRLALRSPRRWPRKVRHVTGEEAEDIKRRYERPPKDKRLNKPSSAN